MVALRQKHQPQAPVPSHEQKDSRLLPTPFTYGAVPVSRILSNDCRLDASSYNMEVMNALSMVSHCIYGTTPMKHLLKDAFVGSRFKRIYTDKPSDIPFFLPSDIEDVYPKATKFISGRTVADIDFLRVEKDMLLMTCSGTIGKTSLVGTKLEHQVFSHDLLRITFKNSYDLGYTYAFFNTEIGLTILQSNNYGAVIDHIEPGHLYNIPIPNAPEETRKRIHRLIVDSYGLRDKSNELIDSAQSILYEELQLPNFNSFLMRDGISEDGFCNFSKKASELHGRIDVSYHLPISDSVISAISKNAKELARIGDSRISKKVILAGVFKRTYVDKSNGVPFLGGREIMTLNPVVDKYLSVKIHQERIQKELEVFENYVLVSDRGTIGKVQIVPRHWNGWAVSQNIIKIVPANNDIAGYVYAYLNSDYAKILIQRETYGAVVDMIDDNNVSSIPIPLLKNENKQKEINNLVLEANTLRYDAYKKEQEAISIMNGVLANRQNKA